MCLHLLSRLIGVLCTCGGKQNTNAAKIGLRFSSNKVQSALEKSISLKTDVLSLKRSLKHHLHMPVTSGKKGLVTFCTLMNQSQAQYKHPGWFFFDASNTNQPGLYHVYLGVKKIPSNVQNKLSAAFIFSHRTMYADIIMQTLQILLLFKWNTKYWGSRFSWFNQFTEMGSYGTLHRPNSRTSTLHEECSCIWALNSVFPFIYLKKCHITKERAVRRMKEFSFKFCILLVCNFQYIFWLIIKM